MEEVYCLHCKKYTQQRKIREERVDKGTYEMVITSFQCFCGFLNKLMIRKRVD